MVIVYFFYKLTQSVLHWKPSFQLISSTFRYFLLCTGSLLNYFLMILLTFSQISLYFLKYFSSLIKKYIHFMIFLGKNMHNGIIFKHLYNQRNIFDLIYQKEAYYVQRFLLISILFIELGLSC